MSGGIIQNNEGAYGTQSILNGVKKLYIDKQINK